MDGDTIEQALATHKWALMAHYETGSGRINDVQGFSEACLRNGVLGMVDAVSRLALLILLMITWRGRMGIPSTKRISCLPLTYAPVSFRQDYIDVLNQSGARCFVHHPLMEARHWGIMDGQDVEKGAIIEHIPPCSCRHEALRLTLAEGLANRVARYAACEDILRRAFTAMMRGDVKHDLFGCVEPAAEHGRARNGICHLLSVCISVFGRLCHSRPKCALVS